MKTVVSGDGTKVAFDVSGAGPVLLLVHGGVSDHTRWQPVLPALTPRFTVHAMDRRGRGGSGDTEPYTIEREFEDIANVVDSLDEPVHLLAHSFGAVCALGAAALTSNIETLTLYEPPPVAVGGAPRDDVAIRMRSMLDRGDRDGVVTTFFRELAAIPPREVESLKTSPSWAGRVAAAHTILREIDALQTHAPYDPGALAGVTQPVLLIVGGDSPPMYTGNIDLLHSMLANSRIAVLPGQQHMAITTDPDLFTSTVLEFLDNPEA